MVSCEPVEDAETDAMWFHVSAYCRSRLDKGGEQSKLICAKFGVALYDRFMWSDGCVGTWMRKVRVVLFVCDERECGLK